MPDDLRFAVVPVDEESGSGFEVQIFVNGVEMTAAGAGLGMDPYAVLIPVNAFVATEQEHTTPVARCDCGVYGCGETDVTITRAEDEVRWEWRKEVPMNRAVVFAAGAYDREVERLARDRSWETPSRTAGRLVLTHTATVAALAEHDLGFSWVETAHDDPSQFRICLSYRGTHQIFVDVAWADRSPEALAADVSRTLMSPPASWTARWHSIQGTGPPDLAAPGWQRYPV